jgi:hypothetical protein
LAARTVQLEVMRMTRNALACLVSALMGVSSAQAQQLPSWTLSPRAVEYGADADDLFELIRFGRLMTDGRVVVADSRGLFVRVYDANGRRTAAFGRRGGGPGAFSSIFGMWLTREGRIGVWDGDSRRVTTFETNGTVVSTRSVKAPASMPGNFEIFLGAFRNGDVLLASLHLPRRPDPNEIIAERWHAGRFSLDGEFRSSAGELQGMSRTRRTPMPFTPIPRAAVRGDSVWVSEGYDAQVKLRTAAGRLARTVELPWRVRASRSHWSQLEASVRERKNALWLELLQEIPRPDDVPSVGGLLLDDRGQLWVKEYDPATDNLWLKRGDALTVAPGGGWRIMNPAGRWVAQVRMPANLMPLDIVGNRLLAVARDEFDVEHVVVHTISNQ